MKKTLLIVMLMNLSLSGCAMGEGDFPSLAKRPYEDQSAISSPGNPVPALVSSLTPDVQSGVNQALRTSNAAHEQFLHNLNAVKQRVVAAQGAAVSSEKWVVAQMDLAALELVRSPSVESLADIDSLYAAELDREVQEGLSGGALIILEKRNQIDGQVRQQQQQIDSMKGQLR
ncbi:hypothetical protein [Parasphingorhabdus sp.]|jgi:hypothetical protein|uniref:hypothetical protein n=1 Tax=Parasphingorhabdus sp. TaxID=2709688 RepID=UPI003D2753C3